MVRPDSSHVGALSPLHRASSNTGAIFMPRVLSGVAEADSFRASSISPTGSDGATCRSHVGFIVAIPLSLAFGAPSRERAGVNWLGLLAAVVIILEGLRP